MNGNEVLVDTNIAIYYLQGYTEAQPYFYQNLALISFISELEILSGGSFNEKQNEIKAFLDNQVILEYIPAIRDVVVEIRKQKKLKLPDAIIAATAIYLDIPLVSADKGFRNIDGLKFIYYEPPVH